MSSSDTPNGDFFATFTGSAKRTGPGVMASERQGVRASSHSRRQDIRVSDHSRRQIITSQQASARVSEHPVAAEVRVSVSGLRASRAPPQRLV